MSTASPPPAAPSNAASLITDVLDALGRYPDVYAQLFESTSAPSIAITAPYAAYTVGLEDIRKQDLTSAARFSSWRYLLEKDGTSPPAVIATADLAQVRPPAASASASADPPWVFAQFNANPVAANTGSAIDAATAAGSGSEVRILQVPALYTVLVWVLGDSAPSFYVVNDPEQQLKPGTPYTEKEVLTVLWDYAQHYQPAKP
jgi:hypothetical protein